MNEQAPVLLRAQPRGAVSSGPPLAGGTARIGFPAVVSAQAPVKWRVQTAWDAGTAGYTAFQKYCAHVKRPVGGEARVPAAPGGRGRRHVRDVRRGEERRARRHARLHHLLVVEAAGSRRSSPRIPWRWTGPTSGRRGSTSWGDSSSRGRRTKPHNMFYVGPIQHDLNLIHSKVPIRSFEEFKGKKIRFPGGMIADIFKQAGVSTVILPGGQVYAGAGERRDPRRLGLRRPGDELRPRLRRRREVHHHGTDHDAVPPPAGRPRGSHGQPGEVERAAEARPGGGDRRDAPALVGPLRLHPEGERRGLGQVQGKGASRSSGSPRRTSRSSGGTPFRCGSSGPSATRWPGRPSAPSSRS